MGNEARTVNQWGVVTMTENLVYEHCRASYFTHIPDGELITKTFGGKRINQDVKGENRRVEQVAARIWRKRAH